MNIVIYGLLLVETDHDPTMSFRASIITLHIDRKRQRDDVRYI